VKYPIVALSLCNALVMSQLAASPACAQQSGSVTDSGDAEMAAITVTANRYETPIDEIGSSITVISAKEIEQRGKTTVLELLRAVPGLDVVQSGGAGRVTSIFMRGSETRYTMVLLDGLELNDPSTTGGELDFAHLTTDNVERIEILRGPQSTLYGSSAMGGVVNIITKWGKGKPTGFISAEGGSYYTSQEKAGISGGTDLFNYSLGVSRFDTSGFSAADRSYGNRENDGYGKTSLNTRFGLTPLENLNINLMLNYLQSKSSLDNDGGPNQDDPNNRATSEHISFRAQADLSLFDDFWIQKLGVSFNNIERKGKNLFDAAHPTDMSKDSYHGQTVKIDWQHILNLHKTNALTFGLERKDEYASSDYYSESSFGPPYSSVFRDNHASITGGYIQDRISLWDRWFTTLGVRVDSHSQFDKRATYRFTSAYILKETGTTFKGSYGTGFKAPSLYQLYSPQYGERNLKPEKSVGWDVGFEQNIPTLNATVGATYFDNDFDDMVSFNSLNKYENISKAKTQGAEAFFTLKPLPELTLKASYTYTKTKDKSTGLEMLRRPRNKVGLNADYAFLPGGNLNLNLTYIGSRFGNSYVGWVGTRIKMPSYVLVNLAASYDINKHVQVFCRIDNLLDKYYEDVWGYGTSRFAGYGGVKLSF